MADGANSDEITVAAAGTIYAANISGTATATYPTSMFGSAGSLGAEWVDLGYASEDGVTFTATPNVEDINVWQKATPARRLVTSRELTLATSLVQWNEDTLPIVFGGGSVYVAGTVGGTTYGYRPPTDTEALGEFGVVIDAQDGSRRFRWVIYSCNITEAVETNLTRSAPGMLPVTFGALTPSDQVRSWYFLSDDVTAFSG